MKLQFIDHKFKTQVLLETLVEFETRISNQVEYETTLKKSK